MGYNQFSKIVEPRPYTPEIDVNVYGKGLLMNEQNMKNTQQNLNNAADNFLNIQTNIPQDAQVLNQRKQEFQNAVKGLNLSNLNNPQTVSQLNQLITKFSTDPDILGIAQRANKLNKDLKDIKDLEEKGKFVPAWKMKSVLDANEYANSGQYLRDKRFNGQIRAGFDWDKHNKDLISSTPEIEILKKSGGNNDLYKGKTYNALQGKFYEGLNQPGALDDLREQFEYSYGNEDYASHDQQTAIQQVNKLQNIIATSNDPILKQQAINDLEYWKDFSTTVNPQVSKEDAFQRYIRANAEDFARTNTNYALKESKMSDANKMYQEHQYRQLEQGDIPGIKGKLSELDKAIYNAVVASGKPIYDQSGNLIPAKDLASQAGVQYNPKESMDNKSGAKQESTMPKKLQNVFDIINTGTALNTQEQEDLTSYVKSNKDLLGTPGEADILDVTYEVENGVKVITWEKDTWGTNTKGKAYVVNSQEEYDKVPKGSVFIDATGKPTKKQ